MEKIKHSKSGCGYTVELGEGKNRHLRRMAESSGAKVLRLKRVAIGPLELGKLKRGECRKLSDREITSFTAQPIQ